MKYKIVFIMLLFPFFTQAQKTDIQDSLIKVLFADLRDSWTLGVDSNNINMVDIRVYNKYKNLFDINARIDDDLNFQFIPGKKSGSYIINTSPKDFDVYAHDVALQVSKLRVDDTGAVKKIDIPGSLVYEISRKVYVEKPRKYVLQDIDSLAGTIIKNHSALTFEKLNEKEKKFYQNEILEKLKDKIRANPDSIYKFYATSTLRISLTASSDTPTQVKIVSIKNVKNSLTCINDQDMDAILDNLDSLKNVYGDFTALGAPDDDLDGVPDNDYPNVKESHDKCRGTYGTAMNHGCPASYFINNYQMEGAIGFQINRADINLPDLNKLGYLDETGVDAMDVLQSRKGSLKNPGNVGSLYAAADFAYFFGRDAKKSGISIGFSYARFTAAYEQSDNVVYTYRKFDGADYYRRQISINSLKEEIEYNVFNIPVLYNYRFKPMDLIKNWICHIKAGPSLMVINASSDYNANIDFGGIYQIDTLNQDRIGYYYYFDPTSIWNVYITRNGINNQNTNPGAAAIFEQLKNNSGNYDFANNKNYREKKKLSRKTVAFNVSFDGQYKRSKDNPVTIKVGVHFVYAPLFEKKEKYKPVDRTTDEFNSIFNSSARSAYFAYGAKLGLIYNF